MIPFYQQTVLKPLKLTNLLVELHLLRIDLLSYILLI
jgi:hypothetical protein